MIIYTLIRSNRKTAAIYVKNGKVEVRAPLEMKKSEIEDFLYAKMDWVRTILEKQQAQANQRESFAIDYGSRLLFRGRQYPITQRDGTRGLAGFNKDEFYMPPGLSPEQIKSTCVRLYKMLAKTHISSRVAFFSTQMGVTASSVKINSAKKRWGSCSSQKSLNFSWRLIMAEDRVIDYVTVHELAHLKEMNHSSRFWALVEAILPDYRERKVKLKELHHRLCGEDWE